MFKVQSRIQDFGRGGGANYKKSPGGRALRVRYRKDPVQGARAQAPPAGFAPVVSDNKITIKHQIRNKIRISTHQPKHFFSSLSKLASGCSTALFYLCDNDDEDNGMDAQTLFIQQLYFLLHYVIMAVSMVDTHLWWWLLTRWLGVNFPTYMPFFVSCVFKIAFKLLCYASPCYVLIRLSCYYYGCNHGIHLCV